MCVITLCTRGALDVWSRGRSTAALDDMATGRKILYFLGAGAPLAAGATTPVQGGGFLQIPTQATFWSTFLRFCGGTRRARIESFLFRYFLGYARTPARSSAADRRALLSRVDVEEVFTFLSERARAPSSTPQAKTYATEVWDALVQEIGNVFSRFDANTSTRKTFRKLLSQHVRSRDAIVSFNYDTVFEQSLPASNDWGYDGLDDCTNRLRILKPHGSINWALAEDGSIKVTSEPKTPVVVAPTHLTFVDISSDANHGSGYLDQAKEVRAIWSEMEAQMKQAKALVFIGYSFPVADLYFSSILRQALADRATSPGLVLVNPDAVALERRLKDRFSVTQIVKYFDLQTFLDTNRKNVLAQVGDVV
jgi:hypothetical protein